MICKLCQKKEADKDNTHYLTDSIIRSCLNLDGNSSRENGFYFDLSNNTPFIDFSFQRNTSAAKLEQMLGRVPTDPEIEKAKKIPFSVDKVFCLECERVFTSIEDDFISKILPKFRETNLTGLTSIPIQDNFLLRIFIYLQIWRSDVCQSTLKLSEPVSANLRQLILNHKDLKLNDINQFPLVLTYLITEPKPDAYTTNMVGFTNDKNPKIILFNDFIIYFFEDPSKIDFVDFYGLYDDESDFHAHVNKSENLFKVKVKSNHEREAFIKRSVTDQKLKILVENCTFNFRNFWKAIFKYEPSSLIVNEYISSIINSGESIYLKYTREEIIRHTAEFIHNKLR